MWLVIEPVIVHVRYNYYTCTCTCGLIPIFRINDIASAHNFWSRPFTCHCVQCKKYTVRLRFEWPFSVNELPHLYLYNAHAVRYRIES